MSYQFKNAGNLLNYLEMPRTKFDMIKPSASEVERIDILLRVKESDKRPGIYEITWKNTASFAWGIEKIIKENYYLRTILKNQWIAYKYSKEYNSFILGFYTDDEFIKIANQYAIRFEKLSKEQIFEMAKLALETLDEYLTSADLSQLLNVDPNDIENILPDYFLPE